MRTLMLICFVVAFAGRGTTLLYPIDPSTDLPFGIDTSSGPISVPDFPYYGQTVSEIWVSQHGILTFDGDNTNPGPGSLPFPTSPGNEGKLLAVFWADHGALGNDVSYYTSTDAALLTKASNDVAGFFPCEASFTPTNVFVATWKYVWPDDYHYGYYSYYHCYTYTYTYPYHYTYYYTYTTTYTTDTYTHHCYTYTYTTSYCYSYDGSYHCTTYPTYSSYCYHTYYTYTYYTTYTTTYTTWYTSTSTTYYCYSTYTYAPENAYQVVLATDGTRTFAFLCYYYIDWTYSGGYGVVGFNRGDGMSYLALPGSGTSSVDQLGTLHNVGFPGEFAFRVDKVPTDIPCVDCQCYLDTMLEKFDLVVVNPVAGPGKQTVTLVERSDVGDFCRFRLEATVKLVDGTLEVKHVFFRFGPHANPDKYAVKVTLKTDAERYREGDDEQDLVMPDDITSGGTHFKVELIGDSYHVTSNTCNWSFDYNPVADFVHYTGSPVVTTGLCGSCV